MKKLLLSLALLLASVSPAFAIDKCMSGSYYNPLTTGTGIDVQISEDTVVVYRYGYLNGSSNYWIGISPNTDAETLVLTSYATYFHETGIKEFEVGNMFLTEEENGFLLEWDWDLDLSRNVTIPWCLGSLCSGEESVIPLFRPTLCE